MRSGRATGKPPDRIRYPKFSIALLGIDDHSLAELFENL